MGNEINNEGVITAEEIKQILDDYCIGKKPLAKLLGWGETTIIRYIKGDVPTAEYSIKLKRLLDNPEFYYDLLLRRKDSLTNVAFRKSKKAVLSKIMSSKIYAVSYYIINKIDADICPGYLQYFLYYIQAFALALNDKEMFQEEYSINNEQVPYLKLYQTLKRCGIRTLELGEGYLSDQDLEIIDSVHESFSWYGPQALREFMRIERAGFKEGKDVNNNRIYTKESIMQCFKDICRRYDIHKAGDIYKYPDRMFTEIKNMNN